MSDKEDQTSDSNKGDKGTSKMVPEGDLIAVKRGLEGQLSNAKSEHDTAIKAVNTQLSDTKQQLLQEQAAKEQLDTQLKSAISKTDMEEATAAKDAAEKRSGELETKFLDLRKQSISTTYKIAVDTLKDKTNEQLDFMEIALKAAGVGQPSAKSFDLGGGAGGGGSQTPIERAKETINAAMEKRGIKTN